MTTAAAPPANGSNANRPSPATSNPNLTGGRQQSKMNSSGKSSDGPRKQAGSPVDGGQRKPPQKAWTQGTNPITQRPNNPTNSNGVNSLKVAQASPQFSSDPMNVLSDRMRYLIVGLLGLPAEITLKSGEKYTGVLSGTTMEPTQSRYVFKMVKRVQTAGDAPTNGATSFSDEYIGTSEDHVVSFDVGDVADLHVPNAVLDGSQTRTQNGPSSGFRTDTDISGSAAIRERQLQRWEPSAGPDVDHSLESTGRPGEWDQFATNERMFGVTSDYNEDLYTTTIDRSNPKYAENAEKAERIAREIESSNALTAHVREERGQTFAEDKGVDEEDKYSGVQRGFTPLQSGGPNKYTPPARRAPTGQPTVSGAPVDPAIISSQLARPDSAAAKSTQRGPNSPKERDIQEPPKSEVSPKLEESIAVRPEQAKEAISKTKASVAPSTKSGKDEPQKASSAVKPAVASNALRKPHNATRNVEHELLDSFKQFSAQERMRINEKQRAVARETKSVRLNDLKKFSQNFKLNTPVPKDLIPILAKDETKQKEIMEKALKASKEKKPSSAQSTPSIENAKTSSGIAPSKPASTHASPSAPADRPQNQRPRPGNNQYASASMRDRTGPNQNINPGPKGIGLLSQRLVLTQQQHRQHVAPPLNQIPHPIPTGPSAPANGTQTSGPNMSSRFNVRANEFRPNPAASTFQPGGNPSANSSPRPDSASRPDAPRRPSEPQETSFFGGQKPSVVTLDLDNMFNPVKRMLKEHGKGAPELDAAKNGGIPFAHREGLDWVVFTPECNKERSYKSMVGDVASAQQLPAPHNAASNGHMHAQHQLPPHLQGPPQGHTPGHTPRHPPAQPHGLGVGPHFDGHTMQFSHSTSSVHPSPRGIPSYIYGGQPQGMPGFVQQGQMPYTANMSPVPQHAALRQQGAPQFMNGPMPAMGGQMMAAQHSNGPFMGMPGNPQMQMYSSAPGPGYPPYSNQMTGPPGSNGYPSPRPGAPMMHQQGSQQGHQQQAYMYVPQNGMYPQMQPGSMPPMRQQGYSQPHQPQHYGSPQQPHQFPQAHRGTPSGSYSQPMMQQHSMPPQGPPPSAPASHGQESNEDAK